MRSSYGGFPTPRLPKEILRWPLSYFGLARHPAGARSRTGAKRNRFACAATQGRRTKGGVPQMATDYNFWKDLFDTYQSLPDWLKFAWLVVPVFFLFALISLFLRYRIAARKAGVAEEIIEGELVYTVYRDDFGDLQIRQHGEALPGAPHILLGGDIQS
jgi:hypothetical protein